jgi:deazaflavin-dependent oxidoreductase (nitroreductase family)
MPAVRKNRWVRLGWKLHRWLYRLTGGRIGGRLGAWPILLLTTTGRRSGRPVTIAISYLDNGGRWVLAASNAGEPTHPSWYLNLRARPEAWIQVGAVRHEVVAGDAASPERETLWERIVSRDAAYAEYQERTSRQIPVVLLTRKT